MLWYDMSILYRYNLIYIIILGLYIYYNDCDMFLKNMIWFDWVAMLPQRFTVLRGMELIDVPWPRRFTAVEKERSRTRPMDCNFDPQIPWFSSMFNHFQSFFMAFLGRKVSPKVPWKWHVPLFFRHRVSLVVFGSSRNQDEASYKSNQRFQMAKLGSPKIYEHRFCKLGNQPMQLLSLSEILFPMLQRHQASSILWPHLGLFERCDPRTRSRNCWIYGHKCRRIF